MKKILAIILFLVAFCYAEKFIVLTSNDSEEGHVVVENDLCYDKSKFSCSENTFSLATYEDEECTVLESEVGVEECSGDDYNCTCQNDLPDGFRMHFYKDSGCENRRPYSFVLLDNTCIHAFDLIWMRVTVDNNNSSRYTTYTYAEANCEGSFNGKGGAFDECVNVPGLNYRLTSATGILGYSMVLIIMAIASLL